MEENKRKYSGEMNLWDEIKKQGCLVHDVLKSEEKRKLDVVVYGCASIWEPEAGGISQCKASLNCIVSSCQPASHSWTPSEKGELKEEILELFSKVGSMPLERLH